MGVQYRFDDEVKDDTHGAFTPEMLNLPQATWIATFVESVIDKSTGLPLFSELVWFAYKVSGVMCSASVCEHCWSIEGCIHSQRRSRLDQKLVEKLVRAHTNLVLRESLDDAPRNLLPWDIELHRKKPLEFSKLRKCNLSGTVGRICFQKPPRVGCGRRGRKESGKGENGSL